MIVLPIDTCEMFWRAFAGEAPPAELEQWIYAHDAELEALLPDDVYLDLISLNFADKWALHEVEKLVGAYVQRDSQAYQRFEDGKPARETLRYLRRLAAQPDDTLAFENLLDYTQHFPFLYDLTNELQDWFADGYRTPLPPQEQTRIRALAQGLLDDIAAEYRHEPRQALVSGADGLDFTRRLLREVPDYLSEHGLLVLEVGMSWPQLEDAYPDAGFEWVEFERGGEGVCIISADELLAWREAGVV